MLTNLMSLMAVAAALAAAGAIAAAVLAPPYLLWSSIRVEPRRRQKSRRRRPGRGRPTRCGAPASATADEGEILIVDIHDRSRGLGARAGRGERRLSG